MNSRVSLAALLGTLTLASACSGASTPAATAPPPTSTTPEESAPVGHETFLEVDPVSVGLGQALQGGDDAARALRGVSQLCEQGLREAERELQALRALKTAPDAQLSWDSTLGALDRVHLLLRNAGDFPGLLAMAHPNEKVREAAKLCEPQIDEAYTGIWLDKDVAEVVARFAKKGETLSAVQQRYLARVQRDFRRNGLELDAAGQKRLRELNDKLTKFAQDFQSHIADARSVLKATPKQVEGLPASWLDAHKPGADGLIEVSTDYPDYFPVMTYAKDRAFALELYKLFDSRAADKNVALLEQILSLRAEKATLLGYATWADYVTEPRMAKSAHNVAKFLGSLRSHLAQKGKQELAEFRAAHVQLGGKRTDAFYPSDRLYLEDKVRQAKYGLDSQEVSQYFEVTKVKQGVMDLTAEMFGLRFEKYDAPVWHPEVQPMQVLDKKTGEQLGIFYFDLHPREGKYKHAAVFSIRDAATLPTGERLTPIAAIVCNFPRPSAAAPALMSHTDAVTFFHEFGHVLHHLLSRAELSTFAGTNVARDFVEAPSQMLEEWAWSRETLDRFAVHHQTGARIPDALHQKMLRARGFGRAIATQRQLFLAALDQAYHTRAPGQDTDAIVEQINYAYTPFAYVQGTHFQASFGHLMGYDAGYYGYQWALSIARDLFTRFQKNGLLDAKTAADYAEIVLGSGSSEDEAVLVEKFLGRAPSDAAYKQFLIE